MRTAVNSLIVKMVWTSMVVLAVALAGGCDRKPEAPAAPNAGDKSGSGSGSGGKTPPMHEHHAPHKGTLVELGEEFAHLELVLDPATGQLTGYVLDGEAEKPIQITQKEIVLQVALDPTKPDITKAIAMVGVANELTGETVGKTSEFTATDAGLKGVSRFVGKVSAIKVLGKDFSDVAFKFPEGNE